MLYSDGKERKKDRGRREREGEGDLRAVSRATSFGGERDINFALFSRDDEDP